MCNISLCQVLLLAECSVDNEVHVLFNILSHSNKSAIFISINCIIHIGHVINVSDNPLLLFKCRKPDYSVLLFITLSFYASSVSHPSTGKNLFSFFQGSRCPSSYQKRFYANSIYYFFFMHIFMLFLNNGNSVSIEKVHVYK